MNGYLTVRRDDLEISQKSSDYENVIRIPKEDRNKSLSPLQKIALVVLILCVVLLIFQFGFSANSNKQQQTYKSGVSQGNKQANMNKPNLNNQQDKVTTTEQKKDETQNNLSKDAEKNEDNTVKGDQKDNSKGGQKQDVGQNEKKLNDKKDPKEEQFKQTEVDDTNNGLDEEQPKKGNIRGSSSSKGEKSKEPKFISTKTVVNEETILWGHYKSHLIYNISQRKNNPFSLSMSYNPDMNYSKVYTLYKDKSDLESVYYDFKQNDGVRFSEYSIKDSRYDFKVESVFIKQKASKDVQQWVNNHKVLKCSENLAPSRKNKSLIFSISKEVYDKVSSKEEGNYYHFQFDINESSISINTYAIADNQRSLTKDPATNKFLGSFVFTVQRDNNLVVGDELKNLVKYSQLYSPKLDHNWDIQSIINSNIERNAFLNNKEQLEVITVNFVLIQFIFEQTFEYNVSISFNSAKKSNEQKLPHKYPFTRSMTEIASEYEKQISNSIESKGISDNHNCTVFAMSNLLGGMTYKFGELQYYQREEQQRSVPKPIFSFTPSRTRFGWSFLWDDGFHNAVASKMQPKLSAFVIKSWLDSQNEEGWICREQTRGEEAFGLCNCPAFIRKDNKDGNPPSLILSLEYFLRDHNNMIEEGYFEKIEKWYHWYLKSQMVKDDKYVGNEKDFQDFDKNSFVFKYWDQNGSKASMNSGLDDYPRNDNNVPYAEPIGHIDAQSWMYHFTTIMEKLSLLNQDIKKAEYYQNIKQIMKERTYDYFFDDKEQIYKDIISNKRSLSKIEYSPHFGYPNLLPLAFGLVENKEEITAVISRIKNPNILWTDHGLRSLSKSDTYAKSGDNYWTGPIWIQMNYLVLRGLKLYYSQNEEATELYKNLRNNVMKTVCGNWEKTGYFYENYNKYDNGQGSNAHPFTGWTATVALVNAENY